MKSTKYDGKPRNVYPKNCEVCNKTFFRPKHRLAKARFCSTKCAVNSRKERVELTCPQCKSRFHITPKRLKNSKSGLCFCSRICKDKAQEIGGIIQQAHVSDGLSSYRNRALKMHGPTCVQCGYDQDVRMLDVDHINGRKDHSTESLQVLCVWCHALKSRAVEAHDWTGKI